MIVPQISETKIVLEPLPSTVQKGDTIIFSGQLQTADGQYYIPSVETIYIKDDVSYGADKVIGKLTTSSKDGTFSGTWIATPRSDGGAYDFYAVFDGTSDLGYARSQTFSVSVPFLSSSSITLDPIASNVVAGTKVIFSGMLKLENSNPAGKTVYIKDEDAADSDDMLAKATVGPDGRYKTSWIVRDVESADRKTLALIANYFVPVGATGLNAFLTTVEKNTVEVYAVFEGDKTSKKSDTCVMKNVTVPNFDGTSAYKQSEQKNCKNNILTISGLDNSVSGVLKSQVISMALSGVVADSDLLMSLVGGGKITQSKTLELKDMLLGLDPIKEKTSGKSANVT